MAHLRRPDHKRRNPVVITMRSNIFSLRKQIVFRRIRDAIHAATVKDRDPTVIRMRIVHFTVQDNHVHFIVEAINRKGITLGSQGVAIRMARAINKVLGRTGKVWIDRYHSRALTTPREVRNALVYVLQNRKKHGALATAVDPMSSAPWFPGWLDPERAHDTLRAAAIDWLSAIPDDLPVAEARTWLLRTGWELHGRIAVDESPKRITR